MRRLLPLLLLSLLFYSSCELGTPPPKGKLYTVQIALDYAYSTDPDDRTTPATLYGTINDARALEQAWEEIAARLQIPHQNFAFLQIGKQPASIPTHQIGEASVVAYPFIDAIEQAVQALASIATENDLTIFSYSGHAASGLITLAPVADIGTEFYDASDLLALVAQIPGRKLVLLDACETGLAIPPSPYSSSRLLGSSIGDWYAQYFAKAAAGMPKELAVITSSADTDSYETTVNGRKYGDFTQALLQSLGWDHTVHAMGSTLGDAFIGRHLTVTSLYSAIKTHQRLPLKRTLINLLTPYHQHPMTSGGAVDMILFTR